MATLLSLKSISDSVGISADIIKLLGLLLLSTPLSIPLGNLSSRSIHVYSILTSSFFLLFVFDLKFGWIQLVSSSLLTWLILKSQLLKSKPLNSTTPWLIFFGLLTHLTINHARRLFWNTNPDSVEITGSQMVLVMKLSTFAWNVYDGQRPMEELDAYARTTSIRKFPGLLEFFGYCFFFPSLLVGPAIPFSDYAKFTYGRDKGLVLPTGRAAHAMRKIAIGLSFAAIVGLYGSRWSYDRVLEDEFLDKNWFHRLWHLQVAGFVSRGKYYLVWSLAEAALAMSGCGYDASKGDWSGGRNIKVKEIELAQNYKAIFDNWNMKTNVWLRECVYKRVAVLEGGKPRFKSTMATFGASAAWHGPLPAYFLAFLSGGLLQALGRSLRGAIRPFFLSSPLNKAFYDGLCILGTQTSMNYLVVPFVLLDIGKTITVYNRLGWYGHISAGIPMILLWAFGLERKLRKFHAAKVNGVKAVENQTKTNSNTITTVTSKQDDLSITTASNLKNGQKVISVTALIDGNFKSSFQKAE